MSRQNILVGALSAAMGEKCHIVSAEDGSVANGPILSINQMFRSTYEYLPFFFSGGIKFDFAVYIVLPSNKIIELEVRVDYKIRYIKEWIEHNEDIPVRTITLKMLGIELPDEDTIQSVGMYPGVYIVATCQRYALPRVFNLCVTELASKYDYDFTDKVDDGKTYIRGGYKYNRPYGWYRFALNIQKYGDTSWLGPNGIRTFSVDNEWAVAYHGTKRGKQLECVGQIAKEGFRIGPGKMHGTGIYTSPSWKMIATNFADTFVIDEKTYKFEFQTRVDPTQLRVITKAKNGADYWVSPNHDAVRPYGIIVKEVKKPSAPIPPVRRSSLRPIQRGHVLSSLK